MSSNLSQDQMEIINEFLQESRDMLDHLEPAIIQLGQSCQNPDCWTTLGCSDSACPRHGQAPDLPCWLDQGYLGTGAQRCGFATSEQECRACRVFSLTNGDGATMNAIFRLFHSMKGSAGFLELNHLAHVAHAAENLLDLIRSGRIRMQPAHVELLCQSCDFSREAMDYVERHYEDQGMQEAAEAVSQRLEVAVQEALARAVKASPPPDMAAEEDLPLPDLADLITPEMVERFVQEADELLQNVEQGLLHWEQAPGNGELIADLFRNIHSFKGNCGFFGYGDLERLSHQMETVLDAAKSGLPLAGKPFEVLLSLVDILRGGIADISRGGRGPVPELAQHLGDLQRLLSDEPVMPGPGGGGNGPRLGELLVEKGLVAPEAVDQALEKQRRPLGEILVEMGRLTPEQVQETLKEQQATAPREMGAEGSNGKATVVKRQDIRVDLEKLDSLINLIGEMVIAENMLIHNPDLEGLELEHFNKAAQQMGKIVRELQEMAMIIRMIPVSGLFRRMIRLVHDLSVKSGKKVDLQLSGEETEVDKTVIETITDPLVHLLRNALDHGLEPPEERRRAGKPEKGTVRLSARHEEGEIWISVEDDGRGLDRERILAKAVTKGLVPGDGSEMSDKAVFNLIFLPGFSTAEKITDISGRGVGMDVVKQNLEKIKGKISVTSKLGTGTRIDLRIPLTLAIIDGMLVRVGRAKCILPLLAIREIFRPEPQAITITPEGQELVRVRERFFPVLRLHGLLHRASEKRELWEGILVVVEYQNTDVALFLDEVLGQQQTVIKGLSSYFGNVRGVSGCTILGDGEVCLILDVGNLVEMIESSVSAG